MRQPPTTPSPPPEGQLPTPGTTPTTPPPRETATNAPDTLLCKRRLTNSGYRTSGLDAARKMVRKDIGHFVLLPLDVLWSIPLACELGDIQQHLIGQGWLSDGGWNSRRISKENLNSQSGLSEWDAFRPLADIFNEILACPQAATMQKDVQCMVHAGQIAPKSDRINKYRPDAFLLMNSSLKSNPQEAPGAKIPDTVHWRDITCPFEYKFGDGDKEDNQSKLLWSLHHELRSDPRRAFSFGVTVDGTKFCIWLACRIALFKFHSIDWFEEPNLLIKFFILLAFSNESDLGFDVGIERVNSSDFQLRFPIQGTNYLTSIVLYDVGADSMCGRGTWVFEVYPQGQTNSRPYVIKDCWVEDRAGKQMEHMIIKKVREAIGHDKFCEHFVNFCSYRKVTNEGLTKYCRIPPGDRLNTGSETAPLVWEAEADHTVSYSQLGQALVTSQDPHLGSVAGSATRQDRLHFRFRYQIVYAERGTSLYDITSLSRTFGHLITVTNGLLLLHEAGFVHRDLSPGNIIVVNGKAKISDLEFAKARKVADLQMLTKRPERPSSSAVVDTRTGTLGFAAVEAVGGCYKFTPPEEFLAEFTEDRIFLYTPLHDYESVWWIATWIIFSCRLNATEDAAARNGLLSDRISLFSDRRVLRRRGMSLPKELHPLVTTLDKMRITLLKKYREYEEKFDGSHILDVVPALIECLQDLVEAAKAIEIKPLRVSPTVGRSDMLIDMREDEGNAFKGRRAGPGEVITGLGKRRRDNSSDNTDHSCTSLTTESVIVGR